jgi:sugar phosphate permease
MWKNRAFSVLCVAALLVWAAQNGMDMTLLAYWKDVEQRSVNEWAIMYLPSPIVGLLGFLLMGFVAHRVPAIAITTTGLLLSLLAPISLLWTRAESSYFESSQYTRTLEREAS